MKLIPKVIIILFIFYSCAKHPSYSKPLTDILHGKWNYLYTIEINNTNGERDTILNSNDISMEFMEKGKVYLNNGDDIIKYNLKYISFFYNKYDTIYSYTFLLKRTKDDIPVSGEIHSDTLKNGAFPLNKNDYDGNTSIVNYFIKE